jgi:hypothetical protein
MAVKFPSGSCGLTSWAIPVRILAVWLLGSTVCVGLARADQPAAADAWSDQRIETAFHDVLAHGDLSDIGFLARTLGLELEVVEWQQPSILPKGLLETRVIAKEVPSYLPAYGTLYELKQNTGDGKTQIYVLFDILSCPDLSPWGKAWNQQVASSEDTATDGGPEFMTETIRWDKNPEGIVLQRTVGPFCQFTLTQHTHAALSVPRPPESKPGPGTELLEHIVDLIAAGDLRDYMRTAHILHTTMSTDGKLRGHWLYEGEASPSSIIPGTDTSFFMYYVNDSGWINRTGGLMYDHHRGPRTARLWISVDTVTTCISPASLEAQMLRKLVHYRKLSPKDGRPYLRSFQLGNAFTIGYDLDESCIGMFRLEQETDFANSPLR